MDAAKCVATHHKSLMQLEIAHAQADTIVSIMNQDAEREQHLAAWLDNRCLMVNAYAQKDIIRLTTEPDARRFIHQIVLEANTQTRVAAAYALMVKKLSASIQDVEQLLQLVNSHSSTEIVKVNAYAIKDTL